MIFHQLLLILYHSFHHSGPSFYFQCLPVSVCVHIPFHHVSIPRFYTMFHNRPACSIPHWMCSTFFHHGVALGPLDLGTLGPWLLAILNCLGQDTVELLARQQVTTIDHLDISNMLTGNMPAIMGMLASMFMVIPSQHYQEILYI